MVNFSFVDHGQWINDTTSNSHAFQNVLFFNKVSGAVINTSSGSIVGSYIPLPSDSSPGLAENFTILAVNMYTSATEARTGFQS